MFSFVFAISNSSCTFNAWTQITQQHFCSDLMYCFLFCVAEFEVAFLDAVSDCVKWQCFFQSPYGNINQRSTTASHSVLPGGLAFMNIVMWVLSLTSQHVSLLLIESFLCVRNCRWFLADWLWSMNLWCFLSSLD